MNSGSMMDLTRDARGRLSAAPSGLSYFDAIAETAGPLPEGTEEAQRAHKPTAVGGVGTLGMPWRIWRQTDPEPGTAPAFDELDRALWFDDMASNVEACAAAWRYLQRFIADEKRGYPGCHLARTPGASGLMLIMHTLPWGRGKPRPYEYPTLDAPTARLLAAV